MKFCENSATLSAELSIPQCGGVVRERHGSVNLVEPSLEIFHSLTPESLRRFHDIAGKNWEGLCCNSTYLAGKCYNVFVKFVA